MAANRAVNRLSDEQINARLAAYGDNGGFDKAMKLLWAEARDVIEATTRDFFGEKAVPYARAHFGGTFDADWIRAIAERGIELHANGVDVSYYVAMRTAMMNEAMRRMDSVIGDDSEKRQALTSAALKFSTFAIEILLAQVALCATEAESSNRTTHSKLFKRKVRQLTATAFDKAQSLLSRAHSTSNSARGMLDKASEVAAAAEQSATAMREAAQTAAGLIRAIENTRSEVETAASVASRAESQAAQAVKLSDALSEQVVAIESILGLIRDIAGQTNLLALNATIEAARAGDSGRGFAVVAQEVKNLANQTASATDDIAAKIGAIQQATRQTVDSNASIRSTVEDVQASAERIRGAMEMQAKTVTMITAAVDETALAADSMSSNIAAIRLDTEHVASEIDGVEREFGEFTNQIDGFAKASEEFAINFAA